MVRCIHTINGLLYGWRVRALLIDQFAGRTTMTDAIPLVGVSLVVVGSVNVKCLCLVSVPEDPVSLV